MEYIQDRIYKACNPTGYEVFLGKIVRIKPKYDSRDIAGRVISVLNGLITLEDRRGRLTIVKASDVSVISEVQ